MPRQRAARRIGYGARDHHRQAQPGFGKHLETGENRGFGVQRVKDRFDQDQFGPAGDQPVNLLAVGDAQIVKGDGAVPGIVDIGAERGGAVGPTAPAT